MKRESLFIIFNDKDRKRTKKKRDKSWQCPRGGGGGRKEEKAAPADQPDSAELQLSVFLPAGSDAAGKRKRNSIVTEKEVARTRGKKGGPAMWQGGCLSKE